MRVKVLEPLETKHGLIPPGKIISIPPETAARLGRKVRPTPFGRDRWQRLTWALIDGFGQSDPGGGCFEWIKVHRPELWKDHRSALTDLDRSFHTGDEELAERASHRATETFTACVEAWAQRHHYQQPELEPAQRSQQ